MSRLIMLIYLGLLLVSCFAVSLGCIPEPAGFSPVQEETVYPLETERGEILLTVSDIEADCNRFALGAQFEALEEDPKVFLLYTVPYAKYCATILRYSGYITLRTQEGIVNRDGNTFTWCVERPAQQEAARLVVQPLTPTARFWIKLARE